jgi:chromosome segregation ATPase
MSDITFLMGEVFPMLEKIKGGFEPANLLSLQSYWSKTRAAIPYLRFITGRHKDAVNEVGHEIEKTTKRVVRLEALQRERKPDHKQFGPTEERLKELRSVLVELNEKQETVAQEATAVWKEGVDKTLKIIADTNVKPWGKEGERTVKAALFNGEKADVRMYEGFQGVLPGRSLFVLILPSRYERTVENALSGLVDWKLVDPTAMADELRKAVKTNPFAGDEADDDLR